MIERGVNGLFVLGSTGMGPVDDQARAEGIATAEFII